jgi:rare lipoprotein A
MNMFESNSRSSSSRSLLTLWLASIFSLASIFIASVSNAADDSAAPATPSAAASTIAGPETGLAAVYSDKLQGRKTANGQRYDRNKLTAAHKTLPFGSMVKVTNTTNKKSVVLRINDRGPMQPDRILDISPRAAKALGISKFGMANVEAVVVN